MRLARRRPVYAMLLLVLGGAFSVTGCARPLGWWFDRDAPDAGPCDGEPELRCTAREGGPCSRWVTVQPLCAAPGVWECPEGSRPREPDVPAADTCLPLYGELSPFAWLASSGIPVERGDGRCMWILSDGVTFEGEHLSHPAVMMSDRPSAGNCLAGTEVLGGDEPYSVADEGELGDDDIASLGDGFRWGGRTWFYYRRWVWDATQAFGVRLLGTGLAWYDDDQEAVQFFDGFLWDAELAFGDAVVVVDGRPYVYGCHGPPVFLSYECHVARLLGNQIGDLGSYEYFAGGGQWSAEIQQEQPVFESGPHRSAVRYHPGLGRFVMLFAHGFGTQIELRTAPAPEGPWTPPQVIAECELPEDDPEAFCATPALHLELMTDWRPDELVVTYDVGTLSPDGEARREEDPAAYWTRMVRLTLP